MKDKNIHENLNYGGSEEIEMTKVQLKSLLDNAQELLNHIEGNPDMELDPWVQSKLSVADEYINSTKKFIVYGDTDDEDEYIGSDPEDDAIPGLEEPGDDMALGMGSEDDMTPDILTSPEGEFEEDYPPDDEFVASYDDEDEVHVTGVDAITESYNESKNEIWINIDSHPRSDRKILDLLKDNFKNVRYAGGIGRSNNRVIIVEDSYATKENISEILLRYIERGIVLDLYDPMESNSMTESLSKPLHNEYYIDLHNTRMEEIIPLYDREIGGQFYNIVTNPNVTREEKQKSLKRWFNEYADFETLDSYLHGGLNLDDFISTLVYYYEDKSFVDPAGGTHRGYEDDPARMYEAKEGDYWKVELRDFAAENLRDIPVREEDDLIRLTEEALWDLGYHSGDLDLEAAMEIVSNYVDIQYGEEESDVAMITVESGKYKNDWWLKKIDSTHFFLSNDPDKVERGWPYHILQHREKPYAKDVRKWLHGGPSPDGKVYHE